MNTKILTTAAALYQGVLGLALTFIPEEINDFFGGVVAGAWVLQLLGACLLGFAAQNWLSRTGLIGGIYNRPLVLANFTHFFIGFFALVKTLSNYNGTPYVVLLVVGILYVVFALCFGYLIRKTPVKKG